MREIEVREGNKFIGAYPASGYSVAYKINFAQPIGEQSFEIDLSQDLYRKELAAARTFGFLSEEKALKNLGLIRGASEENVIVVTETGVKNGALRFEDEFVRHKVLDLIGDLALLGKQIIGRIVADRAGPRHAYRAGFTPVERQILVGRDNGRSARRMTWWRA